MDEGDFFFGKSKTVVVDGVPTTGFLSIDLEIDLRRQQKRGGKHCA